MSIRFLCQNCHKPLEVDDTEAGSEVLCFFCRSRNSAPQQSDPALATAQLAPELLTSSQPAKSPVIGIIGLIASLTMLAILFFIIAWGVGKVILPVTRTPNYNSLPASRQQELLNEKRDEFRRQPLIIAASVTFVVLFLLGISFSIAGIAARSGKSPALAGLIINLLVLLLIIFSIISTPGRHPG